MLHAIAAAQPAHSCMLLYSGSRSAKGSGGSMSQAASAATAPRAMRLIAGSLLLLSQHSSLAAKWAGQWHVHGRLLLQPQA
jgi:hypothetical protein